MVVKTKVFLSAQKLAAVYNNISIISQSNAGLSAARNKGLSLHKANMYGLLMPMML